MTLTLILLLLMKIMMLVDGYPMQDVVMHWKGDSMTESVHGVEFVEIPQFTLVQYRTISTVETLATGPSLYLYQLTIILQTRWAGQSPT